MDNNSGNNSGNVKNDRIRARIPNEYKQGTLLDPFLDPGEWSLFLNKFIELLEKEKTPSIQLPPAGAKTEDWLKFYLSIIPDENACYEQKLAFSKLNNLQLEKQVASALAGEEKKQRRRLQGRIAYEPRGMTWDEWRDRKPD